MSLRMLFQEAIRGAAHPGRSLRSEYYRETPDGPVHGRTQENSRRHFLASRGRYRTKCWTDWYTDERTHRKIQDDIFGLFEDVTKSIKAKIRMMSALLEYYGNARFQDKQATVEGITERDIIPWLLVLYVSI